MQRPESPDQFITIDWDDLALGKASTDNRTGFGVALFLPERRHEHVHVDDEKICIARRHTLSLKCEWPWHRQCDDAELFARRRAEASQPLEVFCQDPVVRITPVRFDARDEAIGLEESRDVVDV